MFDKIAKIISEYQNIDIKNIKLESNLINDIGFCSFDIAELVCRLEDEFEIEIPDRQISSFQTVGDILNFIEAQK